ncbi:uncharacterized protein VTP21DRAFT_3441 [Calcarisporiella thermophila]|uniref:uncharacterized protein n=1 Tax=Calcarisporiella thermophila TaxID=911321 RepID=UPI0037421EAB
MVPPEAIGPRLPHCCLHLAPNPSRPFSGAPVLRASSPIYKQSGNIVLPVLKPSPHWAAAGLQKKKVRFAWNLDVRLFVQEGSGLEWEAVEEFPFEIRGQSDDEEAGTHIEDTMSRDREDGRRTISVFAKENRYTSVYRVSFQSILCMLTTKPDFILISPSEGIVGSLRGL